MTTKRIFRHPTENFLARKSRLLGVCFVVLFSFVFSFNSHSQVSSYTFSYASSPAHSVSAGTTLASGTSVGMDDVLYPNIPIGFVFNFNGIDYTTVGVSTNGFIWFGNTAPAATEYNPISSATAMEGVIACFGNNLSGKQNTSPGTTLNPFSTLKYTTTGTCPNRIFMVQWVNVRIVGLTSGMDLQITLQETTNRVELHPYDSGYLLSTTYTGQMGIRGASNTDFANRLVVSGTNTWATSSVGASNTTTCQFYAGLPSVYPVSGARYRYANNTTTSTVTWTGATSNDWFTSSNWSSGAVPSVYKDVVIPTGLTTYPFIDGTSNSSCKSLTIASGGSLTMATGYSGTFYVTGSVSNNGTLINNGTNYINLITSSASIIGGTGDYSAADIILSGTCTSYSLSNNVALRKLSISTGSTLSMNTFNLTVYSSFSQIGTINQSTGTLQIEDVAPTLTDGTFNENTGTTYFATGINTSAANQTIPSITYYNLKVNTNNGFTASIGNGSPITCNNFMLINTAVAGGVAAAINAITVNANFDLGASGNAFIFNLTNNITITGIMTLYQGVINTNANKVIMNNSAAASVVAGAGNTDYTIGYINGNLRRPILSGAIANYDFPLGDAASSRYIVLIDNALSGGGFSYIDGYFGTLVNHMDADMVATEPAEPGVSYDHICTEGVWFLEPNNQPALGLYDIKASITGFSGLSDDEFAILKRSATSLTGADWDNGGLSATRPASLLLGRTLAGGCALRFGLSSFSQFGIARAVFVPLPIELLSFNGSVLEHENVLEWTTATETSNDYFSVERSTDAANFITVATVDGAGNSTQLINYKTFDYEPLNGLSYYRLKQTDYNGMFAYSNIISLYREQTSFELITIFNSSLQGTLEVLLHCSGNCDIDAAVFDISGKKVFAESSKAQENSVKFVIPTNGLSNGIYLFKASSGNQLITRKIKL